jgi:hypothetical protein
MGSILLDLLSLYVLELDLVLFVNISWLVLLIWHLLVEYLYRTRMVHVHIEFGYWLHRAAGIEALIALDQVALGSVDCARLTHY